MADEKAVAVSSPPKVPVAAGDRGLQLRSIEEMYRFAQYVAKSGIAPQSIDTPEKALIAMQIGMELGLSPMRSLHAVVVIGATPSLKGEAALGLIRSRGHAIDVGVSGEGDAREGWARFCRIGGEERVVTFSVLEAKRAGLWGKKNWQPYPDDMLLWRAVGRAGRRYFSDVLMGLYLDAEVSDMPGAEPRLVTIERGPDPLLVAGTDPEPVALDPTTLKKAGLFADEETVETDAQEQARIEWEARCIELDPDAQVHGLSLEELKALGERLESQL